MTDKTANQDFFSKQTADNWLAWANSGFKSFGAEIVDTENYEAFYKSADKNVRALLDESVKLGKVGWAEAEPKLKAAIESLGDTAGWSADKAAEFAKNLYNGKDTGFAAWSKSVGEGTAEFGGNIMRAAPGVLSGGATFAVIMSTVKNFVGVHPDDGWFSFKGIIAAVLGAPIALMGATMVGTTVHNWWHGHSGNKSQADTNVTTAQASDNPNEPKKKDVASVDLKDVKITSTKMAVVDTERVGGTALPSDNSSGIAVG